MQSINPKVGHEPAQSIKPVYPKVGHEPASQVLKGCSGRRWSGHVKSLAEGKDRVRHVLLNHGEVLRRIQVAGQRGEAQGGTERRNVHQQRPHLLLSPGVRGHATLLVWRHGDVNGGRQGFLGELGLWLGITLWGWRDRERR